MADIPEDDLAESRAALAPTLDATAAILPWVSKPKVARFAPQLNERWIAGCQRLATAWSERHGDGEENVRQAIFNLYAIALETADPDCLGLGEALATAMDRLEGEQPSPKLIAALAATMEALGDTEGLENDAFGERARHFAQRLESVATTEPGERSAVLDALFVDEAREQIELMHEALAALPPDAYALQIETLKLAQHAEQLALWGVMHLARQLADCVARNASDLDAPDARDNIEDLIEQLASSVAAIRAE